MPDPKPTPVPTVALRHTPEEGEAHIDWMWAPVAGVLHDDDRVLVTFRMEKLPTESGAAFRAVRLPAHRARYLRYEGDIGGGRGRVDRVWVSTLLVRTIEPDRFVVDVADGVGVVRVEGRRVMCHDPGAVETTFVCTAVRRG